MNLLKNSKFILIVGILIIILVSFVIYYQSTGYEFVLDDKIVISENSFVKKGLDGIKDILFTDSFTGYFGEQQNLLEGGRYRPLSLVFFAIEHEIFGLDAKTFHLFNILYYSLLSILVFIFLKSLFRIKIKEPILLIYLAFVGAIAFAVHPTHSEAVANIKGRDEILALLFSVLGAIAIFSYIDKRKSWQLILGTVSLFLAFLSKEHTLAFVFIIPFSLYFFRDIKLKNILKLTSFLFIPVVLFFIVRYQALGFIFNTDVNQTGIMNNPYIGATFAQKITTIAYTLVIYIKLAFIPFPLTHDYYPFHIPLLDIFSVRGLLSLVAILGMIGYAFYGVVKKHFASYLIWFYLASIFMMSNLLFNVGTFMNERFMFMGSIFLPILIIWIGNFIIERKLKPFKYIFIIVILAMISGFTYISYERVPAWENTESLNRAAVKVSKNSARANCFMGVWLYEEMLKTDDNAEKQKLIDEAKVYIDKSLSIYPEYNDALTMKAGIATQTYKIDSDPEKLLQVFYEILEVRHIAFVDEYLEWLIRRTPNDIMMPFLYKAGYKLMAIKKKDLSKASYYLNLGYNKDNNNKNILFGLTIVNYMSQKYPEAIKYGNIFLNIDNTNADIYYYTGLSYNFNSEFDKGELYLNKAYELKPELKK